MVFEEEGKKSKSLIFVLFKGCSDKNMIFRLFKIEGTLF